MCAELGQAFSRLEDGWGVWFNVISRPRRKYVERGALWHPTTLTVDEAQRRRFEDASANFERECVVSLVYQSPAPAKQRIFVSLTGSGLERSLSLQQQVSEFERQIRDFGVTARRVSFAQRFFFGLSFSHRPFLTLRAPR
jgi:hypothetical protein